MHKIWLAQAATMAHEAADRGFLATLVHDGFTSSANVAQAGAHAKVMA